jgi:DNA repair protein RecO (recombination protein O)
MLYSTRGIVIKTTKFSETSLIARIFTEQFGMQSYMIKGIRRASSNLKPAFFQPLSLLDLVVYHKQRSTLNSIKEAGYFHSYQTVSFDIRKSSIALFIQELTYKTIREEEPNPGLFDYLIRACTELDSIPAPGSSFPVLFALHLTKHLGFVPHKNYSDTRKFFNLKEGLFQETFSEEGYSLDEKLSVVWASLLETRSLFQEEVKIPAGLRNSLLEKVLVYYQLHFPGFEGIKSHQILHTVLS